MARRAIRSSKYLGDIERRRASSRFFTNCGSSCVLLIHRRAPCQLRGAKCPRRVLQSLRNDRKFNQVETGSVLLPDNPDHPAIPDTSPWSPEHGDFVVPERQSPAFIITNQSAKPKARQREFVGAHRQTHPEAWASGPAASIQRGAPTACWGICHCAMINCPKPTLGRHVAQQSDFDKVAPREICPQVFGPSKTEPLSLRNDKVRVQWKPPPESVIYHCAMIN